MTIHSLFQLKPTLTLAQQTIKETLKLPMTQIKHHMPLIKKIFDSYNSTKNIVTILKTIGHNFNPLTYPTPHSSLMFDTSNQTTNTSTIRFIKSGHSNINNYHKITKTGCVLIALLIIGYLIKLSKNAYFNQYKSSNNDHLPIPNHHDNQAYQPHNNTPIDPGLHPTQHQTLNLNVINLANPENWPPSVTTS